ncbi:MAG: metallophosphoesterase [Candidatus Pacearchaeota archaeon]
MENKNSSKNSFRILAAGDIHSDKGLVKKLADKADRENVDLVILAGDLTLFNTETYGLMKPFSLINKQVLLVPGNHDTIESVNFLVKKYNNVWNLHGYAIRLGDIGIFGAGGANIGPFTFFNDEELYSLLLNGFKRIKDSKFKIMVTHVHPSNSLIEKFTSFFTGSHGVEKAIKKFKPNIAICSHVHEAAGIEERLGSTLLINAGRDGKLIDIKLIS